MSHIKVVRFRRFSMFVRRERFAKQGRNLEIKHSLQVPSLPAKYGRNGNRKKRFNKAKCNVKKLPVFQPVILDTTPPVFTAFIA
jgi:hypothetical protein